MRVLAALLAVSLLASAPALAGTSRAMAAAAGPLSGPDTAAPGGADEPSPPVSDLPPVASADLVKELFERCKAVASDQPDAMKTAAAAGWTAEDDTQGDGPFFTQVAANKEFGGIGPVEMWGTVEYYPTIREGYCRMDFSDPDSLVNFEDFNRIEGLTGQQTKIGEDIYAVWQMGATDPKLMVIAQRVAGDFQMEINTILPAAPPPMVTAPDLMPKPETDIPAAPGANSADGGTDGAN